MTTPAEISLSAIDHLGVVGRDIGILTAAFTRLGFVPTNPAPLMGVKDGSPVPLGQDSAHLIFADSYVELSGVHSTDPHHHLAPFLARYEGLHILALGTDDADASHAALTAQGLETPPVQNAGRHVDYGTKHGDAKFKWFKAPDALGSEGFVCLVEQLTPELVFQPPSDGHPNGALSVSGVTVLCVNVEDAVQRFAAYPRAEVGGRNRVTFGNQEIVFLDEPALVAAFGRDTGLPVPALAGFTVTVRDIAATRTFLTGQGVAVQDSEAGVWVHPRDACGAILRFTQA
jgi:hypothetical protein